MKVPHSRCSHNFTDHALCMSMDYVNVMLYNILETNIKQIPNHSEHLCQDSISQIPSDPAPPKD